MYYSFPSRHSDGYRLQLDSFLDVVLGRGEAALTELSDDELRDLVSLRPA